MDNSFVEFIKDGNTCNGEPVDKFWKIMAIDDEKSVHDITLPVVPV